MKILPHVGLCIARPPLWFAPTHGSNIGTLTGALRYSRKLTELFAEEAGRSWQNQWRHFCLGLPNRCSATTDSATGCQTTVWQPYKRGREKQGLAHSTSRGFVLEIASLEAVKTGGVNRKWKPKVKTESENQKWKLKVKTESENQKWKLKVKTKSENWKWKPTWKPVVKTVVKTSVKTKWKYSTTIYGR